MDAAAGLFRSRPGCPFSSPLALCVFPASAPSVPTLPPVIGAPARLAPCSAPASRSPRCGSAPGGRRLVARCSSRGAYACSRWGGLAASASLPPARRRSNRVASPSLSTFARSRSARRAAVCFLRVCAPAALLALPTVALSDGSARPLARFAPSLPRVRFRRRRFFPRSAGGFAALVLGFASHPCGRFAAPCDSINLENRN